MAKKIKTTNDYEAYKKFHNYSTVKDNKKHFDVVKKVREDFEEARVSRQNNCYWFRFNDGAITRGSSVGGGDWVDRWNWQEKLWSMWYQPAEGDNFRSNVKSPMTTGRVESTLNKLKKVNIRWDARPQAPDDVGKEKVANVLMSFLFEKANIKESLATWFKDALIHGTAIARVYYVDQKRKYCFPMSAEDILAETDKDKRKKLEEQLEDGKVVWGEPQEVHKYKDIVVEPIPLVDFYPDPQARCLHGEAYEARYVVRRRIVSIDDFKAEFETDPNSFNVDKVKPISVYVDSREYTFFEPPQDIFDVDSVEILEYENQITDEYAVLANDILVKYSPLPYNHKEISYHKVDVIEFPHQFYHVGLADFLGNIQGTQEILINLMIDYIFRSMNLKYLVDASVFGEFTESHMRDDSQYIPVDTTDGRPLATKIQQLPHMPIGFDAFNVSKILDDFATLSTQISPTQMALPTQTGAQPATIGMINKEQVELMLSSLIDNFANGGLLTMGRQIWALMQQMYSVPEVKKIEGAKDKKAEEAWRTVRLDGFKIIDTDKGIEIEESDNDYDFFEVKDKYISTVADLEIRIAPDSLAIDSQALEAQRAQQAYAQLMPNAVDPSNTQLMRMMEQTGRIPLWDARKLGQWYQKTQGIPEDVLISKERMADVEVEEAKQEALKMLEGEPIAGIPGRSQAHIKYQAKILSEIVKQMQMTFDAFAEKIKDQEQYDPMTGEPIVPEMDPLTQDRMDQLQKVKEILQKHIVADAMPADMFEESVLEAASAMQSPAPQPPAGMPQDPNAVPMPGNAPVPQGVGGNIPMPQDPSAMAMGMPMNGGEMPM